GDRRVSSLALDRVLSKHRAKTGDSMRSRSLLLNLYPLLCRAMALYRLRREGVSLSQSPIEQTLQLSSESLSLSLPECERLFLEMGVSTPECPPASVSATLLRHSSPHPLSVLSPPEADIMTGQEVSGSQVSGGQGTVPEGVQAMLARHRASWQSTRRLSVDNLLCAVVDLAQLRYPSMPQPSDSLGEFLASHVVPHLYTVLHQVASALSSLPHSHAPPRSDKDKERERDKDEGEDEGERGIDSEAISAVLSLSPTSLVDVVAMLNKGVIDTPLPWCPSASLPLSVKAWAEVPYPVVCEALATGGQVLDALYDSESCTGGTDGVSLSHALRALGGQSQRLTRSVLSKVALCAGVSGGDTDRQTAVEDTLLGVLFPCSDIKGVEGEREKQRETLSGIGLTESVVASLLLSHYIHRETGTSVDTGSADRGVEGEREVSEGEGEGESVERQQSVPAIQTPETEGEGEGEGEGDTETETVSEGDTHGEGEVEGESAREWVQRVMARLVE
ncbi:hypothetical protein KIPB_007430, partial [Kipferlia bialata]